MRLEMDKGEIPHHLLEYFEPIPTLPAKSLLMMPARVVIALQDDGWWLRSNIIWCLSGGTWVYARTQKGEMPMMVRDMARLDPATVSLWNGEKWTQVLGWSKSPRKGDEVELVLRSGERISCTPTHQWPMARGLFAASELIVGDVLQTTLLPEPTDPRDTEVMNDQVAWFCGLYLAEGSRSGDCIQIAGHVSQEERWERVQAIARAYGGSATRTVSGNKMDIRVHGRMLSALLDTFISGRTAKDKCLDPVCWRYSNFFLRALLNGYLSGDGHLDEANRRWRLGFTRNYNLERDLRILAARLDFKLTLVPSQSSIGEKKYPTFRGELRFEPGRYRTSKSSADIMEIRRSRCREVYDIGMADEPHVFALTSGVLTHNSKPNPMPESVTDRPTTSHEHVFLLAKSERYFYDALAIAEPVTGNTHSRGNGNGGPKMAERVDGVRYWHGENVVSSRNCRTVWTIPTQAYEGAHFACVDEDTECLTVEGWKRHDELTPGMVAAQFDLVQLGLNSSAVRPGVPSPDRST